VAVGTDAYFDGSRNNIVKIPKGKLAVVSGLDGYIVAEEGNVLLICKKEDSSALIKKYVNEIQMKRGDEYV
jgi:mannose-1-phosphate guanylyltransferase